MDRYRSLHSSMRLFFALLIPLAAGAVTYPTLPNVGTLESDLTYTLPACTTTVATSSALQPAINAASSGSTICTPAGATWIGHWTFSASNAAYVTVRSTEAHLITGRASESDASHMTKFVSPDTVPALTVKQNASRWRFVGLEMTTQSTGGGNFIFRVGASGSSQGVSCSSFSCIPHHIVIDRCWIHGVTLTQRDGAQTQAGINLDAEYAIVMNSRINEIHDRDGDNQAIAWAFTRGPIIIQNNFLEAGGENVMPGGSDPPVAHIPSNIVIRGNHFWKNPLWVGACCGDGGSCSPKNSYGEKNQLEFKVGQYILIEGNVFENYWNAPAACGAQFYAFVAKSSNQACGSFTVVNPSDTGSYNETRDITIRYNKFVNVAAAFMLGRLAKCPTFNGGGVYHIHDNLIINLGWNNAARTEFVLLGYSAPVGNHYELAPDVTIEHNTVATPLKSATSIAIYTTKDDYGITSTPGQYVVPYAYNFTLRNNILAGAWNINKVGASEGTINTYLPNHIYQKNVTIGSGSYFASANYPRSSYSGLFVNEGGGNYALTTANAAAYPGTDGRPAGADITALNTCTAGATDGTWTGCSSTPVTTVDLSASAATITYGSTVTLSWVTTNVTGACTASGGWSGSKTPVASGSEILAPTATATYTLTCVGATTQQSSVTVTVIPAVSCSPPPL